MTCRSWSAELRLISIAAHRDLEIFHIDITAAYLNTPMNKDVKHKWPMLDRDVASVLMAMDAATGRPICVATERF